MSFSITKNSYTHTIKTNKTMTNEPPQPTEMCEPVINGENVVSDVFTFYQHNELRKAIDDYWASKYPTFAKGRIKRMQKPIPKGRWTELTKRIGCRRTFLIVTLPPDVYSKLLFGTTRWNKH